MLYCFSSLRSEAGGIQEGLSAVLRERMSPGGTESPGAAPPPMELPPECLQSGAGLPVLCGQGSSKGVSAFHEQLNIMGSQNSFQD